MEEAKMANGFFGKHTILCSYVDYYCLVCESRFFQVYDTIKHITTDSHHQLLAKTLYESEDDGIKKIKVWYYCEFCSVVLKTKAKVRLHIVDNTQRYNNVIIAFGDIQIDNEAWDGLCDSTCILCNKECEDVLKHLEDAIHNINFMQSNIKFNNKNIFRLVDETSFHCLTCNSQEALPVTTHFDSMQHKKMYKEHQVIAAKIIKDYEVNEITSPATESKLQEKVDIPKPAGNEKTFVNQRELQPPVEDLKINVPKLLDETKNTKEIVNNTVASNLKQKVKENNKIVIHNLREEEENICKVLNINDYITKDETGSTWCILCDWIIDSYYISNHINSMHHINILKLHNLRMDKLHKQDNENSNAIEQKKSERSSPEPKQVNKTKEKQHVPDMKSRILDSFDRFQYDHIDINFENMSVICRKCSTIVDFDYESIEAHIGEHKEKTKNNYKESGSTKDSSSTKLSKNTVSDCDSNHSKHVPDNKSRILDSFDRFQYDHIDINFENMSVICRKCSTIVDFDYESIEAHIGEHKEKAKNNYKESGSTKDSSSTKLSKNTVSDCDSNHSKLLSSLKHIEKNDININFQTKKVTCNKCSTNLNFDYNTIESHIAYHKQPNQKVKQVTCTPLKKLSPKKDEDEVYAKGNNFKILPERKWASCEKCKTQVPFSVKDMKDHLHTNTHKSQVEADKTKIETIPIDILIHSLVTVKNSIFHDHIINNEICINVLSFILITRKTVNIYKCLCCDLHLDHGELSLHINSKPHLDVMTDMKLVINVKDEFIRQLPSNRYHCGFCNVLFNCWMDVTTHISTMSHEHSKISSKCRLQAHVTLINDSQVEVSIETRFLPENILHITYSKQWFLHFYWA